MPLFLLRLFQSLQWTERFCIGHKEHIVRNACDQFPYELNCIDHQCWAQMIRCKFELPEGKTFLWCTGIWKLFYMPWKHIVLKNKKEMHITVCLQGNDEDVQETDRIKNMLLNAALWVTNIPHQLMLTYVHFQKEKLFICLFSSSRSLTSQTEEAWNQKTILINN